MKRRQFIKNSSVISASALFPTFLSKCENDKKGMPSSRDGKNIVIVQLSGGNDGLNTVVPYHDDLYYKARPKIAIPKSKVLKLNDDLGFHPILEGVRSIFDDGNMSIVNNVGYPNSSRSHFNSMDIWHSATPADSKSRFSSTGWIGRYLDSECNGCDIPYHAMEIEDSLSLALVGKKRCGFAVSDVGVLNQVNAQKEIDILDTKGRNPSLDFLNKMMVDTKSSAQQIAEKLAVKRNNSSYPKSKFAQKLKLISQLISCDLPTKIFYVSLSGFDTHSAQAIRHERVLKTYSQGIKAFIDDLKKNGLFKDTLVFTFSEFGRRVSQNANGGTDHGKANNLFLMGDNLKNPGVFNELPNLANLDDGDLKHNLDFRQIYASILDNWLDVDSKKVLLKKYNLLDLV